MTAPEFFAPEDPRPRRRDRRGIPAWARRTILAVVVAALVGGNAYVVRKQFPPAERRKHESYDRGLRALDQDKDPEHLARAEMEFRRYLTLDPRHQRVRFLLGVSLQYQKKFADARAEYGEVLKSNPQFDDARIALAEMAQADQAYDEAFRQIDLARAEDPTPTHAHLLRARLLGEIGDQEGAVAAYRETLRRDPNSYEAAMELSGILLVRSDLGGGQADRLAAAAVCRDAEEILRRRLTNNDSKLLRMLLAQAIAVQARVLQKRQMGEAVTELKKAAALDPEDLEPTLVLGEIFRKSGSMEEAQRTLEDARRKWSRPADQARVLVALSDLYAGEKRPDDAVQAMRDAVGLAVEDPSMRVRLVAFLASLKRFDDAAKEAETARQRFPEDADVHAAHGDLAAARAKAAFEAGDDAESAKRHAAALASYRRALELRPKSIRLKKLVAGELIDAAAGRAPGAAPTEDEAFARRCVEEVLRVNARDAEALTWRARLLMADGKAAEVVKTLQDVVQQPAPPPDALRLLGAAAARTGDVRLAADSFMLVVEKLRDTEREKATKDVEFGASARDWLNAVQSAMAAGRREVAVETALVAVRIWPSSAELRRALGQAQLGKGDAAAALVTLREARQKTPADVQTRLLLALAYEAAKRLDAAEDELKSAIVDLPSEATRMAYFEFLGRTGRGDLAEQGFVAMTASDPDSPGGRLRLGDFYLALKPPKTDAALAQYEKALALTHGGAPALLRIAELKLGLASGDVKAYSDADAAVAAFAKAAPEDPWRDYLSGKLSLAGGRPEEAVTAFERFTTKLPESGVGLYYYARALRDSKQTEKALDAMERAARLCRDDPAVARDLAFLRQRAGEEAFSNGKNVVAKRLFAAAEAGGAGAGSRLLLAAVQANLGEFDLSEKEFRKFLDDNPRDAAGLNLLAQILMRKGGKAALEEAEALFRRALEVDASDVGARIGVGLVRFERGDFPGALETLRQAYPRTDGSPEIAMTIAQCMALPPLNDATGAVRFLDDEIKLRPKSEAMHHLKGDFLVFMKLPRDAVAEFLAAYDLNPDEPSALLAAAAAYIELRDYESARKLLVAKLPTAKQPGFVHLALGETLLLAGRLDEGGDELRQALVGIPGHPRALYLLGRLAEMQGKKPDAKRLYREAVQRQSPEADAYARLAHIASDEGDRREAIDLYGRALRLDPRNVRVLNNRACLLGDEEGRLDEALQNAKAAHLLAPEMNEASDTYGWLLFRAGRLKEAADLLESAAASLKTDAVVQYHAGMALSRVGRALEARTYLDRALRIDPKFDGADAARAELEKLR